LTHVEQLASIFSQVDKEFSMKKFDDKLQVQKIVYLLQEYGVDLGYNYEWYIRGPYCKQVSVDAHIVLETDVMPQPPEQVHLNADQIKQFNTILSAHFNNATWLEIAASIVYLKKQHYSNDALEDIVGYLIEDLSYGYKNFDESLVRQVIDELNNLNFLNT
jgi:uncharacterized protein YwgA